MEAKATKKRTSFIQIAIVAMFFISVFANIGILLTSQSRDSGVDYEAYDVLNAEPIPERDLSVRSLDVSDLSAALSDGQQGGNKGFIKSLASCIRARMESKDKGKQPSEKSANSLSLSSINTIFVPPSVDKDILRSMNWTLMKEFYNQRSAMRFLERPVINKHDFGYTHNPKHECVKRKIDTIIAVPSAPEYFEFRLKSRQGLKGGYANIMSNNATLLFFIGRSGHHNKSRRYQMQINMEMRRFGDIVQENFIDTYENLTLKSISVLKWISTYCPKAKYVIKCDDDVGVKPKIAVQAMKRMRKRYGNFILGRWNDKTIVQRDPNAKNYVPEDVWPHPTFPPHVLGGAMGFPVTTAKLLYQATLRMKTVWLEDVFMSGLVAPMVNIPVFMDSEFDWRHREW